MSSDFNFRVLTSENWKKLTNDKCLSYEDGLKLKMYEKNGTYTSELLDSGVPNCSWHRAVLDADIPENSTITITFITSEIGIISEIGKTENNSVPVKIVFTKANDALIQAPPGQFIQLIIDFHREGEKSPVLRQVKLYYERISYLRYLPALYQENSESKKFLERFLSIFESSMYDSEETISNIPMLFDPMAAREDFYRWLADWVSLDLYDQLDDKTRREYILRAIDFYKKKGTVSGLADLVSFLTGKKCCIKEYKNNLFRSWGMEHHEEYELENEKMVNIPHCETESDQNETEKLKCTKFYRRISRTVNTNPDTAPPGLLENRGKYCDEIHYVTGRTPQISNNEKTINYSSNSIGIFVFFPFGDKLKIGRDQLLKIIDSFLPVFVTADITYVETPCKESYPLSWINDVYSDKVIVHLGEGEDIHYVQGEYTDNVKDWIRFYTYCREHCPDNYPNIYGRTYSENNPEYRNFRTVHGSVGLKLNI